MVESNTIVKTVKSENKIQIIEEGHFKLKEQTKVSTILQYLNQKNSLTNFSGTEELIFYPELYGICPDFKHENCLNLRKDHHLRTKIEKFVKRTTFLDKRTPILRHIHEYNFVEIYLDNLHLKNRIPIKIFCCDNLRVLSLTRNSIRRLPADIGRLKKLEILYLSYNRLETGTLPHTLTFCKKLHTLFLDNNKMTALPGFLLKMENLFRLKRQNIETSFQRMYIVQKSSRIEKVKIFDEERREVLNQVARLEKLAAKVIIVNKIDYFSLENFSKVIQNVISRIYPECLICENCNSGTFEEAGYTVTSSRYGYLGNYWSIFSHRVCGKNCAEKLLESCYKTEQLSLTKLEKEYDEYCKYINDEKSQRKKCCIIS